MQCVVLFSNARLNIYCREALPKNIQLSRFFCRLPKYLQSPERGEGSPIPSGPAARRWDLLT